MKHRKSKLCSITVSMVYLDRSVCLNLRKLVAKVLIQYLKEMLLVQNIVDNGGNANEKTKR